MLRKINFTGRKKINQSRVDIEVYEESGVRYFDLVLLDLEGMGLPNDASVYIEPFFKSSFKRFYFGTVGEIVHPVERSLEELPYSEIISFRIKIVDESGTHGRLLAFAKVKSRGLLEDDTVENRSILSVNPVDTGPQIWRLSFDPEYQRPTLEISNKLYDHGIDWRDVVRSDEFITLVYPQVVREIARRIAFFERDYDEEGDQWQNLWLKFFKGKLRVHKIHGTPEENEQELEDWVEAVADGFCRRFGVQLRFRNTEVTK